jgi:hypothetical protein
MSPVQRPIESVLREVLSQIEGEAEEPGDSTWIRFSSLWLGDRDMSYNSHNQRTLLPHDTEHWPLLLWMLLRSAVSRAAHYVGSRMQNIWNRILFGSSQLRS